MQRSFLTKSVALICSLVLLPITAHTAASPANVEGYAIFLATPYVDDTAIIKSCQHALGLNFKTLEEAYQGKTKPQKAVIRVADPGPLTQVDPGKNKLILLIHDVHEMALHDLVEKQKLSFSQETYLRGMQKGGAALMRYFECLQTYHDWNSKNRLIIYYENLVHNHRAELAKVFKFLDKDPSHLSKIYDDIVQNITPAPVYKLKGPKKNPRKVLVRQDPSYKVKGPNPLIPKFSPTNRKKQISNENLAEGSLILKTLFPHLWEAYLPRYEKR